MECRGVDVEASGRQFGRTKLPTLHLTSARQTHPLLIARRNRLAPSIVQILQLLNNHVPRRASEYQGSEHVGLSIDSSCREGSISAEIGSLV